MNIRRRQLLGAGVNRRRAQFAYIVGRARKQLLFRDVTAQHVSQARPRVEPVRLFGHDRDGRGRIAFTNCFGGRQTGNA